MTKKARIIAALEAGWTDLEAMWAALERESPHLCFSWSYICRVASTWRADQEQLATAAVVKLERKK